MSKVKNLMRRLFETDNIKYCCKRFLIITAVVVLLELLLISLAYCFGAKCVDNPVHEVIFALFRMAFMLGYPLLLLCGLILCIALVLLKRRSATLKSLMVVVVFLAEIVGFGILIEPSSFYSLKGFVNHVPQKIDVEGIQNWLDNAELKKIGYEFTCADGESFSEEVVALHPRFWSIYNCGGKRAIEFSYGSHGTGTAFGILVIGKNAAPIESMDMGLRIVNIKDVNDDCYLWSAIQTETPVIAKTLGLEIE